MKAIFCISGWESFLFKTTEFITAIWLIFHKSIKFISR